NSAVVEPGAGRREMAPAFAEWRYIPLDLDSGELPAGITGVVFSNEFFDALPVEVAVYDGRIFREQMVGCAGGRFEWRTGGAVRPEVDDYLRRYLPPPAPGCWYEANLEALAWMERIAGSIDNGFALTIDYGYTRSEA